MEDLEHAKEHSKMEWLLLGLALVQNCVIGSAPARVSSSGGADVLEVVAPVNPTPLKIEIANDTPAEIC